MPCNGYAHNLRGPPQRVLREDTARSPDSKRLSRFLRDRPGGSLSIRQTPRLVQGIVMRRTRLRAANRIGRARLKNHYGASPLQRLVLRRAVNDYP